MKLNSTYILIGLIVVVVAGLVFARAQSEPQQAATTQYDDFAQCLDDSGATFYGAFWCPHCNDQKRMFENSAEIPYVECSTPNRQNQTQICIEKEITGYPTWILADGERLDGVQELETLSEKTGCELPPGDRST